MIFLNLIVVALFAIPLAWSKQVNANYYSTKMFLVYLISSFAVVAPFIVLKKIHWPSFNETKKTIYFLGLLLFFQILKPLLINDINFIFFAFKFLSLCALVFLIYNLCFQYPVVPAWMIYCFDLMVFIVLGLTLFDFYQVRIIQDSIESWLILGTFGNINMLGEFYILSLPLVFYWLRLNKFNSRLQIPSFLKLLFFTAWVFIILYSRSRSVWIGFALWLAYSLYKKLSHKELIAIAAAIFLYFVTIYTPSTNNTVDSAKKNSYAERLSLYTATAELIWDHPVGLGLGAFTNEVIPYRLNQEFKPFEFEYADQPHSEFLKWGVQFGWVGLFLSATLIFYIFYLLIQSQNSFLLGSFLVLIPQILFQFPFENPASIVLIAIFIAYFLKIYFISKESVVTVQKKIFAVCFGILLLINSLLFIAAIIVESQYNQDLEKTALMCKIYPINQRNCNYKNVLILQQNQTAQFRSDLKTELNLFYLTSDLQRIIPLYFQKMNDEKRLCESILIYQMMYPVQKHFNQTDVQFCTKKFTLPFQFENPKQFRTAYRRWLEQAIF